MAVICSIIYDDVCCVNYCCNANCPSGTCKIFPIQFFLSQLVTNTCSFLGHSVKRRSATKLFVTPFSLTPFLCPGPACCVFFFFFPPPCIDVAAGSWREKGGGSGSRIPRLPIRSHEPLHWLDKAVPLPHHPPTLFFSLQHLALLLRLPPGCCAL